MNMPLAVHIKTIFDHEVLRARLGIRDFFLASLFREVYENIGQMLSLVKFNLAGAHPHAGNAGEMIGQAIKDLRAMCKNFNPDNGILREGGMQKGISDMVDIIFPGCQHLVQIQHAADDMEAGLKLILFNMLLEILSALAAVNGELNGLLVAFSSTHFEFSVNYMGASIQALPGDQLSLAQRANLVNANLEQYAGKNGTRQITLQSR